MSIKFNNHIDYKEDYQFHDFTSLHLKDISPFIIKYFTPSYNIVDIKNTIKGKYNINPINTCVLFYRGNDKNTEMSTCSYDDIIKYGNEVKLKNPNIRFMIQSDETEFITKMCEVFPNSFYCKDEIRHMNKSNSTVDKKYKDLNFNFSQKYLAITLIMAECNYVICGSGNCSIWIIFYRQHTDNVYQFNNGRWIIS